MDNIVIQTTGLGVVLALVPFVIGYIVGKTLESSRWRNSEIKENMIELNSNYYKVLKTSRFLELIEAENKIQDLANSIQLPVIKFYEFLKDADEASESVNNYDVTSENAESVATYKRLQSDSANCQLNLIDYVVANADTLRLHFSKDLL